MATKVLDGSEIKYSCIMLSEEDYESLLADIPDTSIVGVVSKGVYHPSEDFSLNITKHWILPILDYYPHKNWIILAKHPGHVYYPMSDITGQAIYQVMSYDAWHTEAGIIALVTDTDED